LISRRPTFDSPIADEIRENVLRRLGIPTVLSTVLFLPRGLASLGSLLIPGVAMGGFVFAHVYNKFEPVVRGADG
jgi:hypothetical protein